jgi:hypothetical protein
MRSIIGGLVVVIVAYGCSLLPTIPGQVPADAPQPCAAIYGIARCQAMADVAAAEIGKGRGDVVAVTIVPDPPPEGVTLGGAWPIRVRISLDDGSTHDARLCGGVSIAAACPDEPHIDARSAVAGGYLDVPCGVDPDDVSACATPLPSLDPGAVADAQPISVPSLSVPVDRLGEQEVVVADGSLPNGVWRIGSFTFGRTWPSDLALRDAVVVMELRSLEPDGKPFDNYFLHGWRSGVERVRAVLRFDVLWFQPGATLEIEDVVVR